MDDAWALAENQHALLTRESLRAMSVDDDSVDAMVRMGQLERMARNVFRIPGSVPTWHQRLLAAVLTAGASAVACGWAAAALWKLPGCKPGPIEVLRLRGTSRHARIGKLRETLLLPVHHVTVVDGIPVLKIERTLLTMFGPRTHPLRAGRLLDHAVAMRLTTYAACEVVLAETASQGRSGSTLMRELLSVRLDGYTPTESELEDLTRAVLENAGLTGFRRQVTVGGTSAPIGRVDFADHFGIVVEADSRRHHADWAAVQEDHRRDALLNAAGFHPVRTNWHQLKDEPQLLVRAVRGARKRAGPNDSATVSVA